MVSIKRVYDPASDKDGYRILVDRLWPRGISKEKAGIDSWLKDIAPSAGLRKWYGHDPMKWEEFTKRYKEELADKKDLLKQIKELEKKYHNVTLLFGAKDTEHNQATVLADLLSKQKEVQ